MRSKAQHRRRKRRREREVGREQQDAGEKAGIYDTGNEFRSSNIYPIERQTTAEQHVKFGNSGQDRV